MPISAVELDEVLTRIHEGERASDLESDVLDFKRQPDSKDDAIKRLVDAAVCFANSVGGTLVMGIADAIAGPEAFLGCELAPAIVQRRLFDLITPTLTVGARAIESHGCRLLVVDVLQSFEIHADKQGRSSQRVGTDCVPLSPQDHRRLREERLGVDRSAQRAGRGRDEISPVALRAARDAPGAVP